MTSPLTGTCVANEEGAKTALTRCSAGKKLGVLVAGGVGRDEVVSVKCPNYEEGEE